MTLIIVIVVIVLLIAIYAGLYNSLIQLRTHAQESWSQIDVQLQRRNDLIPNLISTVKGYSKYEAGTLAQVYRVHPRAHGQGAAVPVRYRAPRRGDGRLAHLLGLRAGGELVVAYNLQPVEPRRQHCKGGSAAHHEQKQCAAKHH